MASAPTNTSSPEVQNTMPHGLDSDNAPGLNGSTGRSPPLNTWAAFRIERLSAIQRHNHETRIDFNERPTNSNPCFTCLLSVMILLLLMNIDSLVTPPPPATAESSSHTSVNSPFNGGGPSDRYQLDKDDVGDSEDGRSGDESNDHNVRQAAYNADAMFSFSTYKFTFVGRYITQLEASHFTTKSNPQSNNPTANNNSTKASTTPHSIIHDFGKIHISTITKRSIIKSVRLASIRLELESFKNPDAPRKIIKLSGLDLRDVASLVFQGTVSLSEFGLPTPIINGIESELPQYSLKDNKYDETSSKSYQSSNLGRKCTFSSSLNFDKYPSISLSGQPVDAVNGGLVTDDEDDDFSSNDAWRLLMLEEGKVRDEIPRDGENKLVIERGEVLGTKSGHGKDNVNTDKVEIEGRRGSDKMKQRRVELQKGLNDPKRGEQRITNEDDIRVEAFDQPSGATPPILTSDVKRVRKSQADDDDDDWVDDNSSNRLREGYNDIEGQLISVDCGIRILVAANEVDVLGLEARIMHFSFFFVLKVLFEIRFFLAQVRYTESSSSTLKVSLISLAMQTSVDAFEAIYLLSSGFVANFMISTFVVMGFFKLMLVAFLELKYLVIVWKSQVGDTYVPGSEAARLQINRLIRTYLMGVSFLLIFVLKLLPLFPSSVIVLYLFWVPQIAQDVWRGHRKSLSRQFLVGMSVCRLLFPLYLWGCPNTIFDGEVLKLVEGSPSMIVCLMLLSLMTIQVSLLIGQHFFGPRFFVPLSWIPHVHNYYKIVGKGGEGGGDLEKDGSGNGCIAPLECVICMTEIPYNDKNRVCTPCEHFFHGSCLQQWMDVKPECPTCRGTLPPFP